MGIRKSTGYLTFLGVTGTLFMGLLVVHPGINAGDHDKSLEQMRGITRELGLTDLCLFTEARYTRHLSQADLHSAFQDYPLALDYFPSGSLVLPPGHLLRKSITKTRKGENGKF